ncbi:endonuclease domain-containing protein [Phytoactinopolyspora mesophila]|nr:DUF559 domain-containing protein [Phytoactinopolyspora mesophila]
MPRLHTIPEPFNSRPFRVDEALRAGLTRTYLSGPQFRRPYLGVRIPCTLPDTLEVKCQALSLVISSEAAFSHETAAQLCDLPVPDFDGKVDAMVPPGVVVPNMYDVDGHTGLLQDDVCDVNGLRVVHPERTFFDVAPALNLDSLVILGDATLRHWSTPDRLTAKAAAMRRRRGIVIARQAIKLIRPGVDSPMETRVRLMLVRGGLPCPEVGVDVLDDAGGWLARPDLAYLDLKIAIEYDGDHHRTDKHQWRRDRSRDENMRHAGWIVITLTADDVFRHPARTIARIRHHYAARMAALNARPEAA